ncbi:MAG: recombination protein RecR [Candidatus Acididesulfobacter guangdongensis]|uniref:Recombination protein RecR n=1 Tax=Acididesulfobacter guangdongensis TaxID=2597225 RepID=A0A519BIK2_ACIG2|nr:MAG: recombination protein RecR [Candidatus Acididesulfobacter guangdongensis]
MPNEHNDYVRDLVFALKKLPGIGERTARRLAFHILSQNDAAAFGLANSIINAKKHVNLCKICFNLSSEEELCPICSDGSRNSKMLCIVENPEIIYVFEKSGNYHGYYHVLHGLINPLEGIGPDDIKIEELVGRVANGGFEEIVIALNPNSNGEATSFYIQKLLAPYNVNITALARGIPVGSDLEYVDKNTLAEAISGRKKF